MLKGTVGGQGYVVLHCDVDVRALAVERWPANGEARLCQLTHRGRRNGGGEFKMRTSSGFSVAGFYYR